MKILVTGAKGQLGRCLADVMKGVDAEFFFLDKTQMDLSSLDDVRSQLDKFKPDFVVNASGLYSSRQGRVRTRVSAVNQCDES